MHRVVDHEVAVHRAADRVHEGSDVLQDDRPDRHRIDEVTVADVEMEDARAGPQEDVDLFAEAREVRRIKRRLDLDRPDPVPPGHRGSDSTPSVGR